MQGAGMQPDVVLSAMEKSGVRYRQISIMISGRDRLRGNRIMIILCIITGTGFGIGAGVSLVTMGFIFLTLED